MIMKASVLVLSLAMVAVGNRVGKKLEPPPATSFLEGASEYDAWRAIHRPGQEKDHMSYEARLALFNKRKAQVEAHNNMVGATWTEELNYLADWTPEEFKSLLGYQPDRSKWSSSPSGSSNSFLQVKPDSVNKPHNGEAGTARNLLKEVDWCRGFGTCLHVKSQICGSCWAAATVGMLEWFAEIAWKKMTYGDNFRSVSEAMTLPQVEDEDRHEGLVALSIDYLVDCAPNPERCGGTGGCQGSIVELALKLVVDTLIPPAADYKQAGGRGDSNGDADMNTHCKMHEDKARAANAGVHIEGFETLERNQQAPLMTKLNDDGPIAISVDASNWGSYVGGVYAGCSPGGIVNHAVVLIGYGEGEVEVVGQDPTKKERKNVKYWIIRNSWGNWGERYPDPEHGKYGGYIRLIRYDTAPHRTPSWYPAPTETNWTKPLSLSAPRDQRKLWTEPPADNLGFCGIDTNNQEGVGCEGQSKEVIVCCPCGMCSDSVLPKSVTLLGYGSMNGRAYHKMKSKEEEEAKAKQDAEEAKAKQAAETEQIGSSAVKERMVAFSHHETVTHTHSEKTDATATLRVSTDGS